MSSSIRREVADICEVQRTSNDGSSRGRERSRGSEEASAAKTESNTVAGEGLIGPPRETDLYLKTPETRRCSTIMERKPADLAFSRVFVEKHEKKSRCREE